MPWHFLLGGLTIIAIDVLLAGDNAVVIAMVARTIPRKQRRGAIATLRGSA